MSTDKPAVMSIEKMSIKISTELGTISAVLSRPAKISWIMVLAHGAGAGMDHSFLEGIAEELERADVACLRYNFPYMEKGKKRPDVPAVAIKTIEGVLNAVHEMFPDQRVVAAGKSFGGRMTSHCLAKHDFPFVKAIVYYGFPLHAAGQPSVTRASHLGSVRQPMLFLQGTNDKLAAIHLVEEVCKQLPRATLVKFDQADHAFKVPKGKAKPDLVSETLSWCQSVI